MFDHTTETITYHDVRARVVRNVSLHSHTTRARPMRRREQWRTLLRDVAVLKAHGKASAIGLLEILPKVR